MTNRYAHFAPLLLRFALGAIFIVHGVQKFMGTAGFAEFFGAVGIPAPTAMVLIVGAIEAVGGALVLLGIGTRVAAALLALVMLGAIITVKFSMGFVDGWEFDLALFAASVSLVLSGPMAQRAGESKTA